MRQFAQPKPLSLTDRIANASHTRLSSNSWDRQTTQRRKPAGRDKQAKQ